jgi:hypothetical protein
MVRADRDADRRWPCIECTASFSIPKDTPATRQSAGIGRQTG